MRRGRAWAAILALGVLWGCQGDNARSEPAPPLTVPAPRTLPGVAPMMQVSVSDVQADPSVDVSAIKTKLLDAETALLTCVNGGRSTGILVLAFPIERDGAVGDIVEGSKTTYGSEATRACIQRIVATMRFPRGAHATGRAQVTVTLEVSPRR